MSGKRNATSFGGTELHWKTSGNGVPGNPQEESLAANRNGLSPPSYKARVSSSELRSAAGCPSRSYSESFRERAVGLAENAAYYF